MEYSKRNRPEPAVTPVCTSSGEDASADMLYGDINLANHRANGESSWIKSRTRLSQRVCSLCFSCLSHKALAERRAKPTKRGSLMKWEATGMPNAFQLQVLKKKRNEGANCDAQSHTESPVCLLYICSQPLKRTFIATSNNWTKGWYYSFQWKINNKGVLTQLCESWLLSPLEKPLSKNTTGNKRYVCLLKS